MQSSPYTWQVLVKLESSRQIFGKYSNIKVHENSPSGSRVVPFERTDMTKLIVAFRSFATVSENESFDAE